MGIEGTMHGCELLSYLIDAHWLVFVFCHYDLGKLQQGTVGDSHVTKVGKWSISCSTYGI